MPQQILQVNFTFNVSAEEYTKIANPLAEKFAQVNGCQWKIWLLNDAQKEAGGIYLFQDETSVTEFKNSPLVAAVLSHPALSNFSIKQFEVLEEPSLVTFAPLATSERLAHA